MNERQQFGQKGEDIAARHLKQSGYRIITTNFRNRLGEIDIIAKDGDTLAFVEVKSRRTGRYGGAAAAVTFRKQRKIAMTALAYLKQTGETNRSARFDVVTVGFVDNKPVVTVIKNAFPLPRPWG